MLLDFAAAARRSEQKYWLVEIPTRERMALDIHEFSDEVPCRTSLSRFTSSPNATSLRRSGTRLVLPVSPIKPSVLHVVSPQMKCRKTLTANCISCPAHFVPPISRVSGSSNLSQSSFNPEPGVRRISYCSLSYRSEFLEEIPVSILIPRR
jgi:hypothetical protein